MYSRVILVGTIEKIIKNKDKSGWLIVSHSKPFKDDNIYNQRNLVKVKMWKEKFQTHKDYIYEKMMVFIEGRLEATETNGEIYNYVFLEIISYLSKPNKANS